MCPSIKSECNNSPFLPTQASLDPLLVSSLYASIAAVPRLDSVRLPGGCGGESLGGFLDQNASVMVKNENSDTNGRRLFSSFLPSGMCMTLAGAALATCETFA